MVILTAFSIGKQETALTSRIPIVRTRSTQANNYVRSLETSLIPRILMDSGRRALYAMTDEAVTNGPLTYVEQQEMFTELVLDGTIAGVSSSYMENHTLPFRMTELAGIIKDSMRINTTYVINGMTDREVKFIQDNDTGPWYVRAELNVTLLVNATLMRWNTTRIIKTQIPIEGLQDPYYSYQPETPAGYVPAIKRTGVRRDAWTLEKFIAHVVNATYDHNDEGFAPSFITRLAGNHRPGSKCCGIESTINPELMQFSRADSYANNWTYIDHCFFGQLEGFCNGTTYKVSGFTSLLEPVDQPQYLFGLTAYYLPRYRLGNNGTIE